MKRRDVLVGLGGSVAVWPLSALAQSQPVPVIGFLNSASPGPFAAFAHAFREGLREAGFVDGNNVTIEARWAEGHYERLPNLAADLVGRRVTLIVATGGLMSARAAKAATTTLPVVFLIGIDPVKMGLVSSLNHPGGNATGISLHTTAILEKRLELLRELVPSAHTIGLLVNPNTEGAQVEIGDIEQVAGARGLQLLVLRATSDTDFESAFAAAAVQRADALLVSADPFFTNRRGQLIALAAQRSLPTAYPWREYVDAGGLISYEPNILSAHRQMGRYAGRMLSGMQPSNTPVELPTKYELLINLKTAKALGIDVKSRLLALADEVIKNE